MKALAINHHMIISKTFALLYFVSQLIILSILVIFCSEAVLAEKTPSHAGKLKKDIAFHGHTVSGKYQLPLESTITVEDEKSLDDLIGVRKNFQDRIKIAKKLR